MEVTDIHLGKQLQCNYSVAGVAPLPPLVYGFGPTAVPGTGFFNGGVLIGSPLSYPVPNVPEASLMVGRPNPVTNPLASVAPSILKVTSRATAVPGTQAGTPVDVVLGDPTGPVGITCFCGIQPFTVQSSSINLITLLYDLVSPFRNEVGVSQDIGAKVFGGAKVELGFDANLAAAFNAAPVLGEAPYTLPDLATPVTTLNGTFALAASKKGFDIPHPTKEKHRLRYICLEGPGAEVYFRGKLENTNVIEVPDYWKGLVDAETITVNLTPIGCYQELFVEKIEWGSRIVIKNNAGGAIKCHYTVYGERKDVEKNIPEYEGLTSGDYPGDNSEYRLNNN
jgi:hypothetical protein